MGKRAKTRFAQLVREVMAERAPDQAPNQAEVARSIGVSRAYVNAVLSGQKGVSAENVDRFADALGLDEHARVRLHRAAAEDSGFRINLPDDW